MQDQQRRWQKIKQNSLSFESCAASLSEKGDGRGELPSQRLLAECFLCFPKKQPPLGCQSAPLKLLFPVQTSYTGKNVFIPSARVLLLTKYRKRTVAMDTGYVCHPRCCPGGSAAVEKPGLNAFAQLGEKKNSFLPVSLNELEYQHLLIIP